MKHIIILILISFTLDYVVLDNEHDINLFFVNYINGNSDLVLFLFLGILTLINFLIFNFPKAKIFLGDGVAYFLGVFIHIFVLFFFF